ncbi:VOC family protein [Vreelandella zhaodongensis]|uniref:VOC family protein n=1 Tax=Vreelandella zhaodongensis TaxID=1176240 RepID=UPI003EBDA691
MHQHEKLNYVEFAAKELTATKTFFTAVFGWEFVDYGPEYAAFSNQGLDGGFYHSDACNRTANGGALLVFYSADIKATLAKVEISGGVVVKCFRPPSFEFSSRPVRPRSAAIHRCVCAVAAHCNSRSYNQ